MKRYDEYRARVEHALGPMLESLGEIPEKLLEAMHVAKGTMAIVKQNIAFALGVKGMVMILGAAGYANMWLAVFADVGVAVIAILNSMRALKL